MARLAKYDPERNTLRVLRHRNIASLKVFEEKYGTQGHGRRFRVWRWERHIVKYFVNHHKTRGWEEFAYDKLEWERRVEHIAAWLVKHTS